MYITSIRVFVAYLILCNNALQLTTIAAIIYKLYKFFIYIYISLSEILLSIVNNR